MFCSISSSKIIMILRTTKAILTKVFKDGNVTADDPGLAKERTLSVSWEASWNFWCDHLLDVTLKESPGPCYVGEITQHLHFAWPENSEFVDTWQKKNLLYLWLMRKVRSPPVFYETNHIEWTKCQHIWEGGESESVVMSGCHHQLSLSSLENTSSTEWQMFRQITLFP